MNTITSPLRAGDQGPAVANLQQALLIILQGRQLSPLGLNVAQWTNNLAAEMRGQFFGPQTGLLLANVLAALHIPASDGVDVPTASALNQALSAACGCPPPIPEPPPAPPIVPPDGCSPAPNPPQPPAPPAPMCAPHPLRPPRPTVTPSPSSVCPPAGVATPTPVPPPIPTRPPIPPPLGTPPSITLPTLPTTIPGPATDAYTVRGRVRYGDGSPAQGVIVRVHDQDLRSRQLLFETTADERGEYRGTYGRERFGCAETGSADIVVEVLNPYGLPQVETPIHFNVPDDIAIDVILGDAERGPSEFDRLAEKLTPVLQGLSFADLTEDDQHQDVTFLTGETGEDRLRIGQLMLAHRHARQTGLPPAAHYGWLRQDLPSWLPALVAQNPEPLRAALKAAAEQNTVPATLADQADDIVAKLSGQVGRLVLQATTEPGSFVLGDMLQNARVSPAERERFVGLALQSAADPEEFWTNLRANPDFSRPGLVDELLLTAQLGLLTDNHVALVQAVQTARDTLGVSSLRDLVNLDDAQWTELLGTDGPPDWVTGDTQAERAATYVSGIRDRLRAIFPTPSFLADLRRDAPTDLTWQGAARVLANEPDLELIGTQLDRYLADHADTVFQGITAEQQQAATNQLKAIQRVCTVAPRYSDVRALLNEGLDSAARIAQMPGDVFARKLAVPLGGETRARNIQTCAQNKAATITQFTQGAWELLRWQGPAALQNSAAKAELLKRMPNLEELFGSMDMCACKHCQSVYGPAAYLVDLLEFLRKRSGGQAFKALRERRPDIEYIKLTCENTETPLPYIDLVNEILEFYVAHGEFTTISQPGNEPLALEMAKDTNGFSAEELSVTPQYVETTAYDRLRTAVHSAALPFNRPMEVARTYLEALDSSRYEVMRVFQRPDHTKPTDDELVAERLKLTPDEWNILTGAAPNLAMEFFGYSQNPTPQPIVDAQGNASTILEPWQTNLARVPEFLRRTGIAYEDLIALAKTSFINPGLTAFLFIKTHLHSDDVDAFAKAGFDTASALPRLVADLQVIGMSIDEFAAWFKANAPSIWRLVVLFEPNSKCNLITTVIQHLDGTGLTDDAEWLRLHRFLRLWRKLGWTIEELDQTLHVLGAKEIDPPALRALAVVVDLRAQLDVPLVKLASLWGPLDTHGEDALYPELFLNKAVHTPVDPAFELDADQAELKVAQLLAKHIPAIVAALQVSEEDLDAIRNASGLEDPDPSNPTILLSLARLSQLYRHALLARTLRLRVCDLLALKALCGIDPFTPGTPAATQAFVEVAIKVKQSGFSVAQLNYLFRHVWDAPQNLAPDPTAVALLARRLHDGLKAVADDNRLTPDPTGEVTRKKLATIWQSSQVDQVVELLQGSTVYTVSAPSPLPPLTLPGVPFAPLSYDSANQQLAFTGAMTASEKDLLLCLSDDSDYQNAVDALATATQGAQPGQVTVSPLPSAPSLALPTQGPNTLTYDPNTHTARYLGSMTLNEQKLLLSLSSGPLYQGAIAELFQQPRDYLTNLQAAFLTASDISQLLDGNLPTPEERFEYFLSRLLPFLQDGLSRGLVKQALSDTLKLDAAATGLLVETVLASPKQPGKRLIDDCLILVTDGLDAQYFSDSQVQSALLSRIDSSVAADDGGSPAPSIPGAAGSAVWSGMVVAPNNGQFTFKVVANGTVSLWVGDEVMAILSNAPASPQPAISSPVALRAGQAYPVRLEVTSLGSPAEVQLSWGTPAQPQRPVPTTSLYPQSLEAAFGKAFVLLHKVALLVNTFRIEPAEITYLSSHGKDFGVPDPASPNAFLAFDFNLLPLEPVQPQPGLLALWTRLYDFARLRNDLPTGQLTLLDVFSASDDQQAQDRLAQLTGWNPPDLAELVAKWGLDPANWYRNEEAPRKLKGAFDLSGQLGPKVGKLLAWAVNPTSDAQADAQAQDVVKTVKAQYPEEDWAAFAKPLNDALREKQRAALVAYILTDDTVVQGGITDADQLFEYFFIDVNMSACMMTSRIKQAISSVQTFAQRCLLNLEQNVTPSDIDGKQRNEWMKSYRVWEANRKVFLYPENWMLPELRDDKTPFFKELESQLLQGELTGDTARQALLTYLDKLDDVARLEICGLCEGPAELYGDTVKVIHVFGRTLNPPYVYYHRLFYVTTERWTPWERVPLDISHNPETGGVHLIPVVYERRLYLFWAEFSKQADARQPGNQSAVVNATRHRWLKALEESDKSRGFFTQWQSTVDAFDGLQFEAKAFVTKLPNLVVFPPQPGIVALFASNMNDALTLLRAAKPGTIDPPSTPIPPVPADLAGSYSQWLAAKEAYDRWQGASAFHEQAKDWIAFVHQTWNSFTDSIRPYLQNDDPHINGLIAALQAFGGFTAKPPEVTATEAEPDTAEAVETSNHFGIRLHWSERRQGAWTARRSSKQILSTEGLFEQDEQTWDFTFEAEIDKTSGMLKIACFGRDATASAPREYDFVTFVGHFYMNECQGEVQVFGMHSNAVSQMRLTPDQSRISGQQFEQESGDGLVLYGPSPAFSDYAILNDTPNRFLLAHPSTSTEPVSNSLPGVLYPCTYADTRRLYFAMPTWDVPEPPRRPISFPGLTFDLRGRDPIMSRIPVPDKGDPGSKAGPAMMGVVGAAGPASGGTTFGLSSGPTPGRRIPGVSPIAASVAAPAPMALRSASVGHGADTSATSPMPPNVLMQPPMLTAYKPNLVPHLKFHIFFHPHVCEFIKTLKRDGLDGLFTPLKGAFAQPSSTFGRAPQQLTNEPLLLAANAFDLTYHPTAAVHRHYPREEVDFRAVGAYASYNWELFFHAPMLIAQRFSGEQKFAEALRWFHFIFDPTDDSGTVPSPRRFWRFRPFFDNGDPQNQHILALLNSLNAGDATVKAEVQEWRDDPFSPFTIARSRITAFQKNVVMKYLDNLIAWGDQLFRRDTLESINEAIQLYVIASHILGPRPQDIPPRGDVAPLTYHDIQGKLDAFSNILVAFENEFPFASTSSVSTKNGGPGGIANLGTDTTFYFCIPNNDQLLAYWDTVEDRLFKIRNCMNIDGIVQELPLFEPPIDPALLVKAKAMGLDLNSLLDDIAAPLPRHRFAFLVQKALELCAELKALGSALLSALEKSDAEAIGLLRAGQETGLLEAARQVKVGQMQEANLALSALRRTREVAEARAEHYDQLLANPWLPEEQSHLAHLAAQNQLQTNALAPELMAQQSSAVLDFHVGNDGTAPLLATQYGGKYVVARFQAAARSLSTQATSEQIQAEWDGATAAHTRSTQEWKFQLTVATKELAQIDKQIGGAEIRLAIAQKELANHDQQIENARAVEDFLRNKYTGEELYTWMISELSTVYFQCYKLAYDTAKKAEKAYRKELGLTDSNFIQFGYWDSLRKGLLSGERLYLDLKRLEMAYVNQEVREFEITKHISLVLHDPLALIRLKETGRCEIELPETLFDADYPGHYMRRIKTLRVTLPCVAGPYTGVNCTLTLLSNKTRVKSVGGGSYAEQLDGEDTRFTSNFAAMQSIATSQAQNDSGLFELNFRDERYLPFEGAGVISRWRIELPKETNGWDLHTLSDVVLHLHYTSRDGGELLQKAAIATRNKLIAGNGDAPLTRFFSARHEFPTAWHRFLHPLDTENGHTLDFDLSMDRFPYLYRGRDIQVSGVEVFFKLRDALDPGVAQGPGQNTTYLQSYAKTRPLTATLTDVQNPQQSKPVPLTLRSVRPKLNGLPHDAAKFEESMPGKWRFQISDDDIVPLPTPPNPPKPPIAKTLFEDVADPVLLGTTHHRLKPAAVEDIYLVVHYGVQ